jgi:hypothetical protein
MEIRLRSGILPAMPGGRYLAPRGGNPWTVAAILLIVPFLIAGCSSGKKPAPQGLAAELVAPAGTAQVGGNVPVTFRLHNRGTSSVTVVRPTVAPNLVEFEVKGPDGNDVPIDGPWPTLKPFAQDRFIALGGGQTTSGDFNLADLFTFTQPGRYQVTAIYHNHDDGARFGNNAVVTTGIRSNTVAVDLR